MPVADDKDWTFYPLENGGGVRIYPGEDGRTHHIEVYVPHDHKLDTEVEGDAYPGQFWPRMLYRKREG